MRRCGTSIPVSARNARWVNSMSSTWEQKQSNRGGWKWEKGYRNCKAKRPWFKLNNKWCGRNPLKGAVRWGLLTPPQTRLHHKQIISYFPYIPKGFHRPGRLVPSLYVPFHKERSVSVLLWTPVGKGNRKLKTTTGATALPSPRTCAPTMNEHTNATGTAVWRGWSTPTAWCLLIKILHVGTIFKSLF